MTNNIVLDETNVKGLRKHDAGRAVVFKDTNPSRKSGEDYKAITRAEGGLYALTSSDWLRWALMSFEPVITKV